MCVVTRSLPLREPGRTAPGRSHGGVVHRPRDERLAAAALAVEHRTGRCRPPTGGPCHRAFSDGDLEPRACSCGLHTTSFGAQSIRSQNWRRKILLHQRSGGGTDSSRSRRRRVVAGLVRRRRGPPRSGDAGLPGPSPNSPPTSGCIAVWRSPARAWRNLCRLRSCDERISMTHPTGEPTVQISLGGKRFDPRAEQEAQNSTPTTSPRIPALSRPGSCSSPDR